MTPRTPEQEGCGEFRELVPWLPTGTLSEEEKSRLERHLDACPDCSALMRFVSNLREGLLSEAAAHPTPEEITDFADRNQSISVEARGRIEKHLESCSACRQEVEVLRQVGETDQTLESPGNSMPEESRLSNSLSSVLRMIWRRLAETVFRPAPALAYAAIATVALALLVSRSPDRTEIPEGSWVGGVVLVSDQSGTFRGTRETEEPAVLIESSRRQLLLLELTTLTSPPSVGESYSVTILRRETGSTVWTQHVLGETFAENYTLAVSLEKGELMPGDYTLKVEGPFGAIVFVSELAVK